MQLDTFTANIIVDGKPLEEYDVVSETPTKVTCWVASEEGKSFGVQLKCHEKRRVAAAKGSVRVDGILGGCKFISPGVLGKADTCILKSFFYDTVKRDMMFARIQLSDDDSLLNKEIPKNLGEISLVIGRGEMVMKPRAPADNRDRAVLDDAERLHERSKKVTVHRVGQVLSLHRYMDHSSRPSRFGRERARERNAYKRRLIRNSQPEITFVFKYRPLGVLQADGIAPRPASTNARSGSENSSGEHVVGAPGGHNVPDIKPAPSNDCIQTLIDRVQNLENELKRLRDPQANNPEDRKPKRIKTEGPQERRPPPFAPGEIIDLTWFWSIINAIV
ncbi:hypothetical protein V8E55_004032 [Tylopilus felleus]